MKPFDDYPEGGRIILERKSSGNARQGYGRRLMEITNQESCAYCGVRLVDDYYHWLLLNADHVIPSNENRRHPIETGIPEDWIESYTNIVLACYGCNGFVNQYKVEGQQYKEDWTVPEFIALRDKVFEKKKALILKRREEEMEFFERHIKQQK